MTMQWIGPLASCAGLGVATWIMWATLKDLAIRSINDANDANRWRMIDQLRNAGIATSISIHQPNDDPDTLNDQECVTINADWTNWEDRDYRAASVDVCLAQALNDMGGGPRG